MFSYYNTNYLSFCTPLLDQKNYTWKHQTVPEINWKIHAKSSINFATVMICCCGSCPGLRQISGMTQNCCCFLEQNFLISSNIWAIRPPQPHSFTTCNPSTILLPQNNISNNFLKILWFVLSNFDGNRLSIFSLYQPRDRSTPFIENCDKICSCVQFVCKICLPQSFKLGAE